MALRSKKEKKPEKKPVKEQEQKIPYRRKAEIRRVESIMPFASYSDESDCFVMTDGSCLSILQVRCKDLETVNETDRQYDFSSLTKFERLMPKDHKIVCLNVPTDTTKQQAYLLRRMEMCDNAFIRRQLEIKLDEEEAIMRGRTDKQFFIFIYSTSEEDARRQEQVAYEALRPAEMVFRISKEKKIDLLNRLYNKPSERTHGEED